MIRLLWEESKGCDGVLEGLEKARCAPVQPVGFRGTSQDNSEPSHGDYAHMVDLIQCLAC